MKSAGGVVGQFDVLELTAGSAADSVALSKVAIYAGIVESVLVEERDVASGGLSLPFDLGTPDGCDAVELDAVAAGFGATDDARFATLALGVLASHVDGGHVVVDLPAGRHVRALHLADLATDEEEPVVLRGEADLAGRRLSVAAWDPKTNVWGTPLVAVPSVDPRGLVPNTLTGGSFADSVLLLPEIAGTRIRISLVAGATPDAFSPVAVTVGTVTGWALPVPKDLVLTAPDGSELWSFPGELAPELDLTEADLTGELSPFLDARRSAGEPLAGVITLRAAFPCRVRLRAPAFTGALVRRAPGTLTLELAGAPVPLRWPGGRIAGAAPTTVVADVGVIYLGLRLAEISDALPTTEAVRGRVVASEPVLRALPPEALRGESVVRVGLVGRCPEATDVLVRLVGAAPANGAARLLGTPGTVTVEASPRLTVTWVELPEPVVVDEPVAIEVSAGRGRFLWAGEDSSLVRIAVVDPDPGNRPVLLGAETLLTLAQPELFMARAGLPPTPFAEAEPAVASALFCTVELTDTELRYHRGSGG